MDTPGFLCTGGTLTWNSQTTFVLPIEGSKETTYMFMGDRWAFPKQASAATYVWQPLSVSGYSISIPEYYEAWQINTSTGIAITQLKSAGKIIDNTDKQITYSGKWQHDTSDTLSIRVQMKRMLLFL